MFVNTAIYNFFFEKSFWTKVFWLKRSLHLANKLQSRLLRQQAEKLISKDFKGLTIPHMFYHMRKLKTYYSLAHMACEMNFTDAFTSNIPFFPLITFISELDITKHLSSPAVIPVQFFNIYSAVHTHIVQYRARFGLTSEGLPEPVS